MLTQKKIEQNFDIFSETFLPPPGIYQEIGFMLEAVVIEENAIYFVPNEPLTEEQKQWIIDHLNAKPLLELLFENEYTSLIPRSK